MLSIINSERSLELLDLAATKAEKAVDAGDKNQEAEWAVILLFLDSKIGGTLIPAIRLLFEGAKTAVVPTDQTLSVRQRELLLLLIQESDGLDNLANPPTVQ